MKTLKKILFLCITSLLLISCGGSNNSTDIINPDAEYLYFFGATCPHCQELNARVKEEDLFSNISVEKREVYFNEENRKMFQDTAKDLGLKESETGVPFVYDKISGEHAIGVEPALTLFKKRLNGVSNDSSEESSTAEPDKAEATMPVETQETDTSNSEETE